MSPKAVVQRPGESKTVNLAGKPLAFLVTGENSKHTCMFDWTLPAGFFTGLHSIAFRKKPFMY
jgi:hypothetical protein